MAAAPLRDSPHHRHFGHAVIAEQIAARIGRHFKAAHAVRAVEKALVVGVFGEWGSGKSTVLDAVGRLLQPDPALLRIETLTREAAPAPLTVAIPFNPWRFEKEAHLIVPLLKVAEAELTHLANTIGDVFPVPEPDAKPSPTLATRLRSAGRTLGNAVLGIASAFEGSAEVEIPGLPRLNLKCSPKAALEMYRQSQKLDAEHDKAGATTEPNPFAEAESLYFEFPRRLERLTEGDTASLNLVFLIDDLDRCLPDKAVDLLESIKLFFDVPRCAFVLALDDEVIERGVMHRYRDYFGRHDGQLQVPITGAEYLEKLIHVPIRLPALNRAEAEAFLREHYAELFGQRAAADGPAPDVTRGQENPRGDAPHPPAAPPGPPAGETLLDLFLSAVPRLPRKLQRTAELLALMLDLAHERGFDVKSIGVRLMLARLVILQLFAPELYRFGRRQVNFLAWLEEWHDDAARRPLMYLADETTLASEWGKRRRTGTASAPDPSAPAATPEIAADTAVVEGFYPPDPQLAEDQCRLRRHVVDASSRRTGFHVRDLLDRRFRSQVPVQLREFYELLQPAVPIEARIDAVMADTLALPSTPVGPPRTEPAVGRVDDPDRFLAYILAPTPGGWQQAVAGELEGGVLPDEVFARLLARLVEAPPNPLSTRVDWLETLLPVLSEAQTLRLYRETRLLERLYRTDDAGGGAP